MKFTKTSKYAIRVLTYITSHNDREYFSVNYLHKTLNIPYKYLGQLMLKLTQAGFVVSSMGKKGGYKISPSKDSIYLFEIIKAIEGLEHFNQCILGLPGCSDQNPCSVHKYWKEFQEQILNMLQEVSIKKLTEDSNIKY